jgi:hypothetical protein
MRLPRARAVQVVFASSDHSGGQISEAEIRAAFKTTQSIVYMCITFVAMGVLLWVSRRLKTKYLIIEMSMVALFGASQLRGPCLALRGRVYVCVDVCMYACRYVCVHVHAHVPRRLQTQVLISRTGSRMPGGYTVVATKAVSELLTTDFLAMFTFWIFYVMLFVLVVTIVLQIRALQEALQHFDSTEVIPANFVCFTIGTITTSGVIYGDFKCMAALDVRPRPPARPHRHTRLTPHVRGTCVGRAWDAATRSSFSAWAAC